MEPAQPLVWFILLTCCLWYPVNSVNMQVTFTYNGRIRHLVISDHIDGHTMQNKSIETLHIQHMVNQSASLPSLTITNFSYLAHLKIENVPLETIPTITNVSELVRITISGTKIRIIPTSSAKSMAVIRMQVSNNEIDTIEEAAFNCKLFKLTASCNHLTRFSHIWFRCPENLKILDLAGNRIKHLHNHAFQRLTTLNHLNLMYNRIARIDSAAFPSKFRFLDISFNNISELTTSMFAHNNSMSIDLLFMDYNKLSFLSEDLMLNLHAGNVSLDGNPWQCPCLQRIEHWLQATKIKRLFLSSRRDDPVCVVARNFGDYCVPHVDSELQQTYITALPRMARCLTTPCGSCNLRFKVLYQRYHLQQETPNFYTPNKRKRKKENHIIY